MRNNIGKCDFKFLLRPFNVVLRRYVWDSMSSEGWGEVYDGVFVHQSRDVGQIWIHPELGLQYKRKNESWKSFREGFSGILATRRRGRLIHIQFTTHNHIEFELANTATAVDLHLYLEGMTNLLGMKLLLKKVKKN